jgi:hypothetical protein
MYKKLPLKTTEKYITLIHHHKPTQKIAKRFKELRHNIAFTTNNTIQRHLTNIMTHNKKNTHQQVYINLNIMTAPDSL